MGSRTKRPHLEIALAVLLGASATALASSQRVRGQVTSGVDVLSGVTVASVSEETWKSDKSVTTDLNGYYHLPLQPGIYTITFSLEGMGSRTRSHVRVEVAADVVMDIVLNPAVAESITVTAEVPIVLDTTPTRTVATLTVDGADNRYVSDSLPVAEEIQIRVEGYTAEIIVDGKSVSLHVAMATANEGPVRMLTGALPAEFGGGGAGSVAIFPERAAGDEFDFAIDAAFQPRGLRGDALETAPPLPQVLAQERATLDVRTGGPLIDERLWAVGTLRAEQRDVEYRAASEAQFEDAMFTAKVNAALFSDLSIENRLTLSERRSDGSIGDYLAFLHGTPEAITNARKERSLDDSLQVTLTTEAGYHTAGIDWRFARESFEPDGGSSSAPQRRDVAEGFFAAGGSGWTLDESARQSVGLSGATRFVVGRHEIAGGAAARQRQVGIRGRLTGDVLIDHYGDGTIRRFLTLDSAPAGERDEEMTHRDTALYLQDHARFGSRLAVNAGLRWERLDARRPGLDFITRALLPRVNVVYDLTRDSRARVSAAYSVYNEELSDYELAGLLTRYGIGAARDGKPAEIFSPAAFVADFLKPRWSDELVLGLGYTGSEYRAIASAGWRRLRNDIVRTLCGDSVCITNPPGRERDQQTLQLDLGKAGWRNVNLTYLYSRIQGNSEPRLFPQTHFTVDPYFDTAHAFGDGGKTGPLHTDRTHSVTLAGSNRLFGVNLNYHAYWKSGSPISRYGVSDFLGTYPYLLGPRGEAGRTPSIYDANLSVAYEFMLFERVSTRLTLTVQNVLDAQRAIAVDERWAFREVDNGRFTPANPHFGQPILRTPPRTILFSLRLGSPH